MDAAPASLTALLGRVLLSAIFLMSGVMKIMTWSHTVETMQHKGMTAVPFLLGCAIGIELVCGFLVLIGFKTKFAAWILFLFLIPVTLTFHDFWKYEGSARENQTQHFMKNVTIMGGLLTLAAAGAGGLSIDAQSARRRIARGASPESPPLRNEKRP